MNSSDFFGSITSLIRAIEDDEQRDGLFETFDELWNLIKAPGNYTKERKPGLSAEHHSLRWVNGYGYEPVCIGLDLTRALT